MRHAEWSRTGGMGWEVVQVSRERQYLDGGPATDGVAGDMDTRLCAAAWAALAIRSLRSSPPAAMCLPSTLRCEPAR